MGEAANKKNVEAIRQAINSHPGVIETVEFLTMHLAPKQILVNVHVNLKNDLTNEQIVRAIGAIETKIKEAEPKVDMIFLETAGLNNGSDKETIPEHIG